MQDCRLSLCERARQAVTCSMESHGMKKVPIRGITMHDIAPDRYVVTTNLANFLKLTAHVSEASHDCPNYCPLAPEFFRQWPYPFISFALGRRKFRFCRFTRFALAEAGFSAKICAES